MRGLLLSEDGNVQLLGNADIVTLLPVLIALVEQVKEVASKQQLENLKQVSDTDLEAELQRRASAQKFNDTNVPT